MMKTLTFPRYLVSLCVLLAFATCIAIPSRTLAQESTAGSTLDKSIAKELDQLRAKVRQLETVLGKNGQTAKPGMGMGMNKGKGMSKGKEMAGKGMAMGKKMADKAMGKGKEMAEKGMAMGKKMAGKGVMGRGPKMGGKPMESALPGFPGASHLYHIGETGFFLNHPEHVTLTADQQKKLNDIKTKTLLADATFERQMDEAEQQMWTLTAAAEPDIKTIESKIREIAKLQGDRRLAYIRGVGDAAAVLNDDQRKTLVGEYAPETDPSDSTGSDE